MAYQVDAHLPPYPGRSRPCVRSIFHPAGQSPASISHTAADRWCRTRWSASCILRRGRVDPKASSSKRGHSRRALVEDGLYVRAGSRLHVRPSFAGGELAHRRRVTVRRQRSFRVGRMVEVTPPGVILPDFHSSCSTFVFAQDVGFPRRTFIGSLDEVPSLATRPIPQGGTVGVVAF